MKFEPGESRQTEEACAALSVSVLTSIAFADLDLPTDVPTPRQNGAGPFVAPPPGIPVTQKWMAKAKLATEFAAAGAFDQTMRMLKLQLGFANFDPLKANMLAVHSAAFAVVPGMQGLPAMSIGLEAKWSKSAPTSPPEHPALPFSLTTLSASLTRAYKLLTEGKFSDCLTTLDSMLLAIPLTTVETRQEVDELKELLSIVREYHIAVRCELARRQVTGDSKRVAELAAYFTHCKMQPVHMVLALRSAMTTFYKSKLFLTCATFARRLLELNPPEKISTQARQVLAACEKSPTDAAAVDYDPRNPFDLCSLTWTPVYKGSKTVACPYTGAKFTPDCAGKISPLGNVAKIGADASGLVCSLSQLR